MILASHCALLIKISSSSWGWTSLLERRDVEWQGYRAILGLESPAGMLAIPGPWASLRQARSSGTRFRKLHRTLTG